MGTPLLPRNSGVLGKGVLGDMVLGQDYTRIEDLTSVYDSAEVTLIEVYTSAWVLCGVIGNYEYFQHVENLYDFSTFEIQINRHKANASKFVTDGFIRFREDGREHICRIETKEVVLDKEGKASERLKFTGRGPESIFIQPCMYNTTGMTAVPGLTFTFAASTTVTASASCRAHISAGDYICNSVDASNTYGVKVAAVSADGLTITLASTYTGTTGSGQSLLVGGAGTHDTPSTVIPAITFTFAASTTVTASASCLGYAAVGYYIYNSTDDTQESAVSITAISADGLTITLASQYAGTVGSSKAATICGCHAETALRQYVDKECITPTDSAAIIPGLSLAADGARGPVVIRSVRFDNLSDVLFGISTATQRFFRLVHGTGLNFVFTIYEGNDVSGTVTITTGRGNVAALAYLESLLEMKNVLYVAGSGSGSARLVRKVYAGTTEPTGWARRAKFVDASDLATDALLESKGTEVLATVGESVSLEVDYLPSPTYALGVQFDIGDIITVVFEDVATVVSRITKITRECDASTGKSVKLGIGKEAPDLVSIVKLNNKLSKAQSRR